MPQNRSFSPKRLTLILLAGSLLLLTAVGVSWASLHPRPPVVPHSPYYTLAELRDPHDHLGLIRHADTAVLVSFFTNGRMNVAQHVLVRRDGTNGGVRFVKDWAVQGASLRDGPPGVTMPAAQSGPLYAALRALPTSQPYTRDADAFIVSWDDGGTWTTRTYDRTHLPSEVRDLCTLLPIAPTWL